MRKTFEEMFGVSPRKYGLGRHNVYRIGRDDPLLGYCVEYECARLYRQLYEYNYPQFTFYVK